MGLILTDDQLVLRDMAKSFCDEKSPVERMRTLRDTRDETGFTRGLWKEMGELGWIGILFPEAVGGAEMGYGELGSRARTSVAGCWRRSPSSRRCCSAAMPSCSAAANPAEGAAARGVQRGPHPLPGVPGARTLRALCRSRRARPATATASGFVDEKQFVLDGHVADQIVTVARTAGSSGDRDGLSLFVVDANTHRGFRSSAPKWSTAATPPASASMT